MTDGERFRYRIAINNNIKKTYSYLDFKRFGVVTVFNAFSGVSSGPNKHEELDEICIYFNYQFVCVTKIKKEALRVIERLIVNCPNEAQKDYENYKHLLFRDLK